VTPLGQFGLDHLAEFSRLDAEVVADQFIQVRDLDDQLGLLDLTATHASLNSASFASASFRSRRTSSRRSAPARVASNCSR
jgi:hypothetical protein